MIKAVLFDMDGTLVNTLQDLADAVNYALAQYNISPRPVENFKSYAGSGTRTMLERALMGEKPPCSIDELLKVYSAYYKEHFHDKTRPYNGVVETVEALHSAGIKLGVVTNKIQYMSEQLAEIFFPGKFLSVQGQRDPFPVKPDPALPNMAAADLGVKPSECIFVGDSDIDIITAHNFGAVAVGALWGFRSREELAARGADHLVEDPTEIIEIVRKYNHNA